MTEKTIQIAIAKADLIISAVLRTAVVLVPLILVFLVCIILAHHAVHNDHYHWFDSCWIDYDAPGVDITSEGPDDFIK